MRIWLLWVLTFWATAALPQDVLIIGDSMLGIHKNKTGGIEEVITQMTGLSVENRAQAAARMVPATGLGMLVSGVPVSRQMQGHTAPIVVMNGGGNDLAQTCQCKACDAVLDSVLTEDGQGAMGQLARGLTGAGTRVVLVGYYNWAPGGKAFVGCKPYLAELDRRMIRLARNQAGIAYVDTKPVIDVADPTHLKPDGIHPSLKGAGLIGRAIARSIGKLGAGG